MTDCTRELGLRAIAAIEARNDEDALMYLTAFCQAYSDTRTQMVIDCFMDDDYAGAVEQMRMQMLG